MIIRNRMNISKLYYGIASNRSKSKKPVQPSEKAYIWVGLMIVGPPPLS
jgi:hypothetical protein